MKIQTVFFFLLVCTLCSAAESKSCTASYSSVTPTVDGRIDGDPAWNSIPWNGGFSQFRTARNPAADTRFKVLYTKDAVYVAVECAEPRMNRIKNKEISSVDFWIGDYVELFLVPAEKELVHVAVCFNNRETNSEIGALTAKRLNQYTGWLGAVSAGDGSWSAEFALPMGLTGGSPGKSGRTIPFNVCRHATPDDELSSWSFQESSFHDIEHFGGLTLAPPPENVLPEIKASLLKPHWISLIKRWELLRADPSWETIFKDFKKEFNALEAIYANPAEYARNAAAFAENLSVIESQADIREKKLRAQLRKTLFDE